MTSNRARVETALYLLLFFLAAGLRLYRLGEQPLTTNDAANALDAYQLAHGGSALFGDHAGYTLWTAAIFFLSDASEFSMRLFPALAGALLALAPRLYRRFLGEQAALILAAAFAFDPLLLHLSRLANGDMPAFAFLMLAAGFVVSGRVAAAGVFSALAVLSGSAAWHGLAVGAFAYVGILIYRRVVGRGNSAKPLPALIENPEEWSWKRWLAWFGGSLVLFSTVWMSIPAGINAILSGLVSYPGISGQAAGVPLREMAAALLFYEQLPLVLGLVAVGLLFNERQPLDVLLLAAVLVGFILLAVNPGRQYVHLAWALAPVMVLVARQLARHLTWRDVQLAPFLGMLGLVLVAFVFAGFNFRSLFVSMTADTVSMQLRIAGVVGAMILIPVLAVIVIWGWNWQTAWKALLTGGTAVLLVLSISAAARLLPPNVNSQQEIPIQATFIDRDLLTDTIADFSVWGPAAEKTEIVTYNLNSSALVWALRDLDPHSTLTLPALVEPEMVISGEAEQVMLSEQYTGQSFVLQRNVLWQDFGLIDWIRWSVTRIAPTNDETIILWIRSSLFPGYETDDNQ